MNGMLIDQTLNDGCDQPTQLVADACEIIVRLDNLLPNVLVQHICPDIVILFRANFDARYIAIGQHLLHCLHLRSWCCCQCQHAKAFVLITRLKACMPTMEVFEGLDNRVLPGRLMSLIDNHQRHPMRVAKLVADVVLKDLWRQEEGAMCLPALPALFGSKVPCHQSRYRRRDPNSRVHTVDLLFSEGLCWSQKHDNLSGEPT